MSQPLNSQYFLTLFDEFSKVKPEKIQAYLDLAAMRLPASVWGTAANYAACLLTAHMLTASGRGGQGAGGGAVNNQAVGDLSRGFASCFEPGTGDSVLRTTRYGLDFIALRKETIVSIMPTFGTFGRGCF